MTQIGLHIHIRVTRGIMICAAKAKLPTYFFYYIYIGSGTSQLIFMTNKQKQTCFLRRVLNVVDLGPELQRLLKVKEDLI